MPSEARKRATSKYAKKLKRVPLDFSPAEADMLAHLEKQPQKATYIKRLIREDMERGK